MQTTAPPVAPPRPVPKKSRWPWLLVVGFLLLFVGTPLSYYLFNGLARDRELAGIYAELDANDPNWRWPDLVAAYTVPPDDKNSAVQALKVHAMLQKTPFRAAARWENASPHPLDWRNARLSEENVAMLKTAFDKLNPQIVKEARMLKDMPHGRLALENTDNPFAMILKVQEIRSVLNLLHNDVARRAHDPADIDGAAQSCQALLNTAGAIDDHPLLISQLVRIAGQAISIAAIERTLAQGEVSEKELQTLQEIVERHAAHNPLHSAMRGERAATEQIVQSLKAGKVKWSDILNSGKGPVGLGDQLTDVFPGLLLGGHAEHLRMMNESVRASQLADPERLDEVQKQEQKLRETKVYMSRLLMPATVKVAMASQRTQAQLRSTAVGLAAERYRLKHGRWPGEIAELVQDGLLKEVPNDPYDGKPLRLKRTQTGIVVYSVSQDKKDNGGRFDRVNVMAADTDLGFELWHPKMRAMPTP